MKLKLSSYNTTIMSIMTASTQSYAVSNVYSKCRKIFVRLYMMSNQRLLATTMNASKVIPHKHSISPLVVSKSIAPFSFVQRHFCNTFFALSLAHLYVCRFIRTCLRTETSFTSQIRELIEHIAASFTVFVYTLFGHQSEYNKFIGVKQ